MTCGSCRFWDEVQGASGMGGIGFGSCTHMLGSLAKMPSKHSECRLVPIRYEPKPAGQQYGLLLTESST